MQHDFLGWGEGGGEISLLPFLILSQIFFILYFILRSQYSGREKICLKRRRGGVHDFPIIIIIIIIINNQPTVKESCPDGNGTLNSRVELQPLTRVCLGLMDHIGFKFFFKFSVYARYVEYACTYMTLNYGAFFRKFFD